MGTRGERSPFPWSRQSTEDNCRPYLYPVPTPVGSWYLQQMNRFQCHTTDVGLSSQRAAFLQNKCLPRSLNSLKVLGWMTNPSILCPSLPPSPAKVSAKESEIKCNSSQLMASMTQIETGIWSCEIMHKQRPSSVRYGEKLLRETRN